jgi:hypothetical protein
MKSHAQTDLRVGRALDHLLDPLESPEANGRVRTIYGASIDGDAPIDLTMPETRWENRLPQLRASPTASLLDLFARTNYRLFRSGRFHCRMIRLAFQWTAVGALTFGITWFLLTAIR